MGLLRNGKICISGKAKFHRTDLVVCSHSREGKTPCDCQTNTVILLCDNVQTGKNSILCYPCSAQCCGKEMQMESQIV